jgi:outer membrane protein assembly factor BamB
VGRSDQIREKWYLACVQDNNKFGGLIRPFFLFILREENMTHLGYGLLVLGITVGLSMASAGPGQPLPAAQGEKLTQPFVQWAVQKDFDANEPHDPLVVQDKVIVGTDRGDLRAYRCENGKTVWTHQHGERIVHRPASDGQRVYFTSSKGLTAVKIEDGTEVWNFGRASCDGPNLALPKAAMVYVGGDDGNIYAVDAKTGKQLWVSDFLMDAPPDPPKFSGKRARLKNTNARPSALASDGETIFLSVFDQCRVIAVNATDGKRLWSFQTGGWVLGSAIATDQHVFFGSQDNTFYCLNKKTGKQVWKYETKARIESGGAVDEKFVYFGSCDGGVYCLSQSDGKERWRFALDLGKEGRKSAIYSVPLLRQGCVYIAGLEGQAYAIDQDAGKLKWKLRPSEESELVCSPATDGALFFYTSRAEIIGRTGERVEVGAPSLVAIGQK